MFQFARVETGAYILLMMYNIHMYTREANRAAALSTMKPVLSDHGWAPKKWSLNRGGLLIEAKMHGKATIGT